MTKPKTLLKLSRCNYFLYIKIILSLLRIPLKSWKDVGKKSFLQVSFKGFGFQLCWWNNLRLESTSYLEGSQITLQNQECVKELPALTTKLKVCSICKLKHHSLHNTNANRASEHKHNRNTKSRGMFPYSGMPKLHVR